MTCQTQTLCGGCHPNRHCDFAVRLPVNPAVESLNVSVAAAIALYELGKEILP